MKHLTVIENYFRGKLDKDELNEFFSDLKKNPELKDEFEKFCKINESVDLSDGTFFEKIRTISDFDFDPDVYLDILKYEGHVKPGEKDVDL